MSIDKTPLVSGSDWERELSVEAEAEEVQVICVGLMRTGLQSLHRAFSILGYRNIYDQEQI